MSKRPNRDITLEFGPDGLHRVIREPVETPDLFFRNFADSVGFTTRLFTSPRYTVWVNISKKYINYIARITTLPLNTWFGFAQTGSETWICPGFNDDRQDLAQMKLSWKVPDAIRLYFVMNLVAGSTKDVLFFLPVIVNGQVRKLPLSNTYNEGRVCMGQFYVNRLNNLLPIFLRAVRHMENSTWNADLLTDEITTRASRLFRWSPENNTQLPADGSFTDLTIPFSNTNIAFMEQFTRGEP